MELETKRLENAICEVTVKYNGEEWADAQKKALNKLARSVKIDGFRNGKAPLAIVKKRIGKAAILEQATDEIVNKTYVDVLTKSEQVPVAQPTLNVTSVDNDELVAVFSVPVYPNCELGEYKGLDIQKVVEEVTEDEINDRIESYRNQFAEVATKEGAAETGDTVVLDYKGTIDGVAFDGGTAENYSLELGSGTFIPGFEDQLVGVSANESKDVVVTFPENYQADDLAGKEATFACTVHEVKSKTLPEVDDELALDVEIDGVETIDQLKENIKETLAAGKEDEAENTFTNAVTDALLKNCTVEESEPLMASELNYVMTDIENNLKQQGLSFEMYEQFTGQTKEDIQAQMKPQADNRYKLNVILGAIAEAENIEVTEEDIDKELESIGQMYNRTVEDLKELFKDNMDQITGDLKTRKALDFVKENVKK